MSAAHEAAEHAADAAGAIDEVTLESLHAEVLRLARSYATTPPPLLFLDARRVRSRAYRMLERTRRPNQTRELYLIAGQLSGLLAATSFDLSEQGPATEQARAALTYGNIIEHDSLCGWARAILATIAFWSGRPGEGVAHAQAGLAQAERGDTSIRLHAVAARALALTGARDEAVVQLNLAEEVRQRDEFDDLASPIGGEFAFGPARQALSAGASYLAMGDPRNAATSAGAALAFYKSGTPDDQMWVGGLNGARIDLATARTLVDDLEGAVAALGPTLELPPEHRTGRIATRLLALRSHLAAPRLRGSQPAAQLAAAIEDFTSDAITALPLPPTGTVNIIDG